MTQKLIAAAIAGALVAPFYMAEAEAAQSTGGSAAPTKKKEKPKIEVEMKDGRKVLFPEDTKAKKDFVYRAPDGKLVDDKVSEVVDAQGNKSTVTNEGPVGVRWDFSNGETRTILLTDLSNLTAILGCHGLSQKGGDEYASEKDVDDAVIAFDDLMDRLKKGEWSERREGGFGGASVLAKAIAEVFGKSMDEVRAFLRDLNPAEKMSLRQTPELKAVIERLEAEKAKSGKVDTAALLAKAKALGGGAQPAAA